MFLRFFDSGRVLFSFFKRTISWAIDKNVKFYHIVDTEEEAVASELNAGLNVRTFFEQSEVFIEALRRALQKGLVEESTLDQRVREVLYVKFWLGLFDDPYVKDTKLADKIVNSDKNQFVNFLRRGMGIGS